MNRIIHERVRKILKNITSKVLIILVFLNLIIAGQITSFASNDTWSAQSISNFLYNKIDASDVLKDEKYIQPITREDFAQLIIAIYCKSSNINKEDIQLKANPFKDTDSIDIQRAYSLDIINGKSKDKFYPQNNITREEASVMITRFLNLKGINTNSKLDLKDFSDKKDISKWAYNSLAYCVEENIINGVPFCAENFLKPKDSILVQEVIIILDRICIRYNWYSKSNMVYCNGFLIPTTPEFLDIKSVTDNHFSSDRGVKQYISFEIIWNNIDDLEKFKTTLKNILKNKINEQQKVEDIVDNILILNLNDDTTIETNEFIIQINSCFNKEFNSKVTPISIYEKK